MANFTEEQAKELIARAAQNRRARAKAADQRAAIEVAQADIPRASGRGHKYGARATVVDGIRFPSIAEAKFYERSKERQAIGEIFYFTLWPVFVLPGGIRVRLDQQIVYPNNNGIDYYDVKGVITPQFKKNKRLVEHFWPIKIKVVIYQKGKFVEVEI